MARELVGEPVDSGKQEAKVDLPRGAAAWILEEAAPTAQAAGGLTWRW